MQTDEVRDYLGSAMRSPEYSGSGGGSGGGGIRRPPEPQHFEAEYYTYLKPESFTVLPPEELPPAVPSPPRAPDPYKLTPRKRHKNQAFAIIAEPGSQNSSRSGSPTGRVSPFRGRGFNPLGSRHVSPAPSPPPTLDSDTIITVDQSFKSSRIPLPIRRRSFVEEMLSSDTSSADQRTVIQRIGSRSMTNIAPRNLVSKPPPSPRRGSNLKQSFVRLSPIVGSSPEAGSDQLQSSPSRIPRSKSQPPSRLASPTRTPSRTGNNSGSRISPNSRPPSRPVSRNGLSRPVSRNASRNPSRNASREPSPTGSSRSPTKIPMKNSVYKNIPAKIDSFTRVTNNSKPKVPQKPKVYSTRPTAMDRSRPSSFRKNGNKSHTGSNVSRTDPDETETTDTERGQSGNSKSSSNTYSNRNISSRFNKSDNKSKTSSSNHSKQYPDRSKYDGEKPSTSKNHSNKVDERSRSDNNDRSSHQSKAHDKVKSNGNGTGSKQNSQIHRRNEKGAKDSRSRRHDTTTGTSTTEDLSRTEDDDTTEDARDDDILSVTIDNIVGTSTTQIVSATTETVVKPLNIEAKLIKQSDIANSNKSDASNPSKHNTTNASKTGSTTNSRTTTTANQQRNSNNSTTMQSQTKNDSNTSSNNTNVSNSRNTTNGGVVTGQNTLASSNGPSNNNQSDSVTSSINQTIESVNNNVKHVTNSLTPSVNSLEMNSNNSVHNFNNLTPPDTDKVNNKSLMESQLSNSANERLKQARTVIIDEIKPIKITVREKSGDIEVQSGNYALPRSATNGIMERPRLPPANHSPNHSESSPAPETAAATKKKPFSNIFKWFKKKTDPMASDAALNDEASNISNIEAQNSHHESEEQQQQQQQQPEKKPKFWQTWFKKKDKVGDVKKTSSLPKIKKGKNDDENWADRRDSILSEPIKKEAMSVRLKKAICCGKCKRKPADLEPSRRPSMMSKKKSLSSTMQPPQEDTGPKLDSSLVEHASHMRGAIPILPIPLAWTCLIFNVFLPGIGTILSGLFCLCIGIPRFSPRDGIKPRIGAFLIDIIVGISQLFTVLFCLVGWGWSIWWGVIMIKIARKYRKIKILEENAIEETLPAPSVTVNQGRDVERGKT